MDVLDDLEPNLTSIKMDVLETFLNQNRTKVKVKLSRILQRILTFPRNLMPTSINFISRTINIQPKPNLKTFAVQPIKKSSSRKPPKTVTHNS